ncbi:MAG TPA: phosphatase PAP2 family protein [Candidatus Saccharimonadaceae bacterium]|nr:phosphatase PAP2 family protein [Candidatus Saccharimonadaceae bacterium]
MTPELLIRLIADISVYPIVLIGAYALLFRVPKGTRFEVYSRVLMAGLTAYMLAKFIGTIYQPADLRPFELLGVEPGAAFLDNPGFPSDHMLFVTAITAAVWFETRMKKTTLLLIGLVLLVGVGRVLALVHTPLDVIGGVVIALIGALWYVQKRGRHGTSR